MENLICPVMTMGSDFLEHCCAERCAWWSERRGCCGVLPPEDEPLEARYWITEQGLAAIGKDGDGQPKPAKLLSEYLY